MAIKNYDQAVSDGDIWVWEANDIASNSRFNQNVKFATDQLNEFKELATTQFGLVKADVTANLTKIEGLISNVTENLSKIETKVAIEDFNNTITAINNSVTEIVKTINNLDSVYQTDSEAADTINSVNEAWLNADGSLSETLTALVNDRYNKSEIDDKLAIKANISNVYDKTTMVGKLSAKLDVVGGEIKGSITPDETNSYDLGNDSKMFKSVNAITVNTTTVNATTVNAENLYDKDATDDIATALDNKKEDKGVSYKKEDTDRLISDLDDRKANKSDIYTSAEIDSKMATSAYGIKYKWADADARDNQAGMKQDEQGVQSDTRTVYKYNDGAWEEFYKLDGVHNHDDKYYTKPQSDSLLDGKADKSKTFTKTEVTDKLGSKVDKISGKGLSTNDFTDEHKTALDDWINGDTNFDLTPATVDKLGGVKPDGAVSTQADENGVISVTGYNDLIDNVAKLTSIVATQNATISKLCTSVFSD